MNTCWAVYFEDVLHVLRIVTGDVDVLIYHHRVAHTHAMKQSLQVEKSRRSKEEDGFRVQASIHSLKGDKRLRKSGNEYLANVLAERAIKALLRLY